MKRLWLDVGSHLGEKTFGPAAADPDLFVVAFEPIWELVAQRIGKLPNFLVLPTAVAETPGTATFHLNQFTAASSLLPFDKAALGEWLGGEELHEVRTVTVPVARLDRVLDCLNLDSIDFLKIDAQGADLSVLKSLGDRLSTVTALNLEVQITPQQLYVGGSEKQAILDYLKERGFELTGTEVQSRGQEENLTFENRQPRTAPPAAPVDPLIGEVPGHHVLRPLAPYPGWEFGSGFDDSDPAVTDRRHIWNYFHDRKLFLPATLKWLDNLSVRVLMGDDFSRTLFVGGCYEPNEFWFLSEVLKPGMTVIDAGANLGLYSLFCGSRVGPSGEVWAFEPSLREFGRLVDNVRRNNLEQVKPIPVALSDQNGVAVLKISETQHSGQSTLGGFAYQIEGAGTEAVVVRTLDGFCKEVGIPRVDLIKMDVEGAELALLRGARETLKRDKPIVLFEANDKALAHMGTSTVELIAELQGLGYGIWFCDADGLFRPAAGKRSDNLVAVHPGYTPEVLAKRRN